MPYLQIKVDEDLYKRARHAWEKRPQLFFKSFLLETFKRGLGLASLLDFFDQADEAKKND